MSILKIRDLLELKALFGRCTDPDATEISGVPIHVRADNLTAEQVASLNQHNVDIVETVWVLNTQENLEFLAGLEPATPDDVPFLTIGGKSYVARRNGANRPRTESRIGPVTKRGTYSNRMLRGLWGSIPSDPYVFDFLGRIKSAQHRIKAELLGVANGMATARYILISVGMATQLGDWTDKAKARKKADDNFVDDSVVPLTLIGTYQTERTPVSGQERERMAVIGLRSKVTSMIENRLSGKDIPLTGGKQDWEEESVLADRLGTDGDYHLLDHLAVRVYESGRSQTSKHDRQWLELFAPSIVATGLILASNGQDIIDGHLPSKPDGETVEDYSNRVLESRLAASEGPLALDQALVEQVLTNLATSTADAGPYQVYFAELFDKIKSHKTDTDSKKYLYAPLSIGSMSAFVQLLKYEQEGSTGSIWTNYRKAKDGKYNPSYRCFGGLDIGFQPKESKSKE